jgi:hypothetical protein
VGRLALGATNEPRGAVLAVRVWSFLLARLTLGVMAGELPGSAGWYPDPDAVGAERYWNGAAWTSSSREATAVRQGREASTNWWLQLSPPKQAALVVTAAAVILVVALAAIGAGGSHYGPKDVVDGSLSKTCEGLLNTCTSPDAAGGLKARSVWCQWNGGHVEVHAILTNTMAASVRLSIVPKYAIKNGGQHGTSFGSDIPVRLGPSESQDWLGDAGAPTGVPAGTPIAKCSPRLLDISIG